jgi:hypothetical protein
LSHGSFPALIGRHPCSVFQSSHSAASIWYSHGEPQTKVLFQANNGVLECNIYLHIIGLRASPWELSVRDEWLAGQFQDAFWTTKWPWSRLFLGSITCRPTFWRVPFGAVENRFCTRTLSIASVSSNTSNSAWFRWSEMLLSDLHSHSLAWCSPMT